MLHEPDRHEPLSPIAWDASRARDAIARIVAGTKIVSPPIATGRSTRATWSRATTHGSSRRRSISAPPASCGRSTTFNASAPRPCGATRSRARRAAGAQSRAARRLGQQRFRLVPDGRHADPADGVRPRAHRGIGGPAGSADRRQHRTPGARTDVGRARHPARRLFLHERSGDARWAELFRRPRRSSGRSWSGRPNTVATTGRRTSTASAAPISTRCTASSPPRSRWSAAATC